MKSLTEKVTEVPLRIDFAGGWLDVPSLSRKGGYIVNCAISPLVSLVEWNYQQQSGLGGSAAWAILNGKSGFEAEIALGAGWQDPAVIEETGVCIWKSGKTHKLELKQKVDWLQDKLALYWTNKYHNTAELVGLPRNFEDILKAGITAKEAVEKKELQLLGNAIMQSYTVQLAEGMKPLPKIENSIGMKYCGSGFGGYALYLFEDKNMRNKFLQKEDTIKIEPYIKGVKNES